MDNKVVLAAMNVHIPNGATILEVSEFATSWETTDDTKTRRVVMEVNGHNVQIVKYDWSTDYNVMVDGGRIVTIPLRKVDGYIRKNT